MKINAVNRSVALKRKLQIVINPISIARKIVEMEK